MTGLTSKERRDRLRLARTEGVGPVAFGALLSRFGSASRALEALPDLSLKGGRASPLKVFDKKAADAEIETGKALGAHLLVLGDRDFPRLLGVLDPPPPVLWTLGARSLLETPAVALVGARTASASGQRFARQMALDLGAAGYTVVSGMARGIDAAAHQGALGAGTIAVLAGGIDDIYPPEHEDLYRQIAAQGLVVSENAVGRRAAARDFPRRNRIISGLSLGVVVVEAEVRSGSLITARLAAEQGREVFAVPGSPLDPRSKGPNSLIRQGANLCESAEDVIRVLSTQPLLSEPEGRHFVDPPQDEDALAAAAESLREQLFGLLSPTAVPRDELVRLTGAPASAVLAALVELNLAGRAEFLAGSKVRRGD